MRSPAGNKVDAPFVRARHGDRLNSKGGGEQCNAKTSVYSRLGVTKNTNKEITAAEERKMVVIKFVLWLFVACINITRYKSKVSSS